MFQMVVYDRTICRIYSYDQWLSNWICILFRKFFIFRDTELLDEIMTKSSFTFEMIFYEAIWAAGSDS